MIDLRQIEEYIDKLLSSPDADTHKMRNAALEKIKLHIESYNQTENSHYLLEIRRLIESIKLVSLSSSISLFRSNNENCIFMGDILAKKNFNTLTQDSLARGKICYLNGLPDLTLSISTEKTFGWIYQTIYQKLPVSTIQWEAAFTTNESGGITSNEIVDWQSGMQEIEIPLKAVRDFRRDITILGNDPKQFKDDEDAMELVQKLIDQSTYTDEEKMHLKPWMLAKGGQEMNFFITDMINKQSLFNVPEGMLSKEHDNTLSTRSFATESNWSLDKEGKIVYHQNMHIRQIINGNDCLLTRNANGKTSIIRSDEPEYESALLQKSQHDSSCLVSINSHVRLDVNSGKIRPAILSLNVTSQTDAITPPINSKPTASASAAAAAATSETPHTLTRPHSSRF